MIYLDNAATTRTAPEVVEAMLPFFSENYGNASSIYTLGSVSKKALNQARRTLAEYLGARQEEIYFTAGGSEADNWALKAAAEAYAEKGKHIITTKIEHHAILHTCEYLEKQGYEVTYVGVDENGIVKLEELKAAIRPDTILISVMYANNEIGTLQPIREIGQIAHESGILFHTDAVQAFGQLPMNVDELHIDMLSASAHKVNGPKGVGCLYIRSGLKLRNLIHGGAQERSRRAGTENIPGIVGFGKAIERAVRIMPEKTQKEIELRDYLIDQIYEKIPYCRLNGDRSRRLPGNVNFSFQFIEGESLLIMLDMKGICGSSGSACTSGSLDPSHVLLALGMPHELAHGSLRLTLSEENTREEMDTVVEAIAEIVGKLRAMYPLYEEFLKSKGK
ncbi:MAG: cysteine desulfurase NifS [Acetatifactor sp.]|nr:cysteine desulfurase NifS [Acetatifactor sp.]